MKDQDSLLKQLKAVGVSIGYSVQGVPVPHGCGFVVNGDTVSITVDNLRLMLMSARVH